MKPFSFMFFVLFTMNSFADNALYCQYSTDVRQTIAEINGLLGGEENTVRILRKTQGRYDEQEFLFKVDGIISLDIYDSGRSSSHICAILEGLWLDE